MTQKQKRSRFVLVIGGALVLLAIGFVGHRVSTTAQTQNEVKEKPVIETNLNNGRRVIRLDEAEWHQDVPLPALVRESRIIAIGIPTRNVGRLTQNGQSVITDYEFRIQQVIKGNMQPNSTISVIMPGGMARENTGNLIQAQSLGVRKMQNQKRYLVFLKNSGDQEVYETLRGSQGIYEIPQNGTRLIHLGRSFRLAPADDGPVISSFLQEIRNLVRNQ